MSLIILLFCGRFSVQSFLFGIVLPTETISFKFALDDRSINNKLNVTPEKIKDNCYVLVKFEKKTSVVYYVGKVLSHYSDTEMKISYLRKKPGLSWSFFFPDIEDIHTLYISDVAMILPDPQPRTGCTSRMARIFTFVLI